MCLWHPPHFIVDLDCCLTVRCIHIALCCNLAYGGSHSHTESNSTSARQHTRMQQTIASVVLWIWACTDSTGPCFSSGAPSPRGASKSNSSAYASAKALFSPSSTSRLGSTHEQTQRLQKEGSLGSTQGRTSRLQKEHSVADKLDEQWRAAASSYAAEVLHPAPRYVCLCCAVLCCAVLCCDVLCCAGLCAAVLCCAVLCCAVLSYAAPRYGCAKLCWAGLCYAVLCCALLCRAWACPVNDVDVHFEPKQCHD